MPDEVRLWRIDGECTLVAIGGSKLDLEERLEGWNATDRNSRFRGRGLDVELLLSAFTLEKRALEPGGFEPPTFWLPARRSPN